MIIQRHSLEYIQRAVFPLISSPFGGCYGLRHSQWRLDQYQFDDDLQVYNVRDPCRYSKTFVSYEKDFQESVLILPSHFGSVNASAPQATERGRHGALHWDPQTPLPKISFERKAWFFSRDLRIGKG